MAKKKNISDETLRQLIEQNETQKVALEKILKGMEDKYNNRKKYTGRGANNK